VARLSGEEDPAPTRPDERWGLDFLSDALASGRRLLFSGLLALFTREALAIEVDRSLPGAPTEHLLHNGPELTGRALDGWAAGRGVRLRCSAPGRPSQHGFGERFNGRFRAQCLHQSGFTSLAEARATGEAWRRDGNGRRPHSALGYRTPAGIRAGCAATTTTTTTTKPGDHTTDERS
jgi:putative transposase